MDGQRGPAGIGELVERARAVAEYVLRRLTRIVRRRKRFDLKVPDDKAAVIVDYIQIADAGKQRFESGQSPVGEPYRNRMAARQARNTADMVVVLVGDDDGRQIFGGKAKAAETAGRLAEPKSTVEQNPGGSGLNDQGIAPTAAAQRCEAHRAAHFGVAGVIASGLLQLCLQQREDAPCAWGFRSRTFGVLHPDLAALVRIGNADPELLILLAGIAAPERQPRPAAAGLALAVDVRIQVAHVVEALR